MSTILLIEDDELFRTTRAEALISIAHPDFRDELVREAERMGIWRRSNRVRTETATVVAFHR